MDSEHNNSSNPSETKSSPNSKNLSLLVSLAKALKENPWYLSIVLVIYLDGYLINLCIQSSSQMIRPFVIPELASGLAWTCFIATLMVGAVHQYLPFNRRRARDVLIASLMGAPATSLALPAMLAARRALDPIAFEIHQRYGKDLRLLAPACAAMVGLGILMFLLRILMKTLRKAMKGK